ncbi:MAG: hypothetical protein AMXMBFR80_28730 [Dehalococcoidia bacterium]
MRIDVSTPFCPKLRAALIDSLRQEGYLRPHLTLVARVPRLPAALALTWGGFQSWRCRRPIHS